MELDRWPVTMAYVKDFDGYLVEILQHHEGIRPSLRGDYRPIDPEE